jgi:hypothetical protein
MTIHPLTRAALHRVAPHAYGDDPVFLTDALWLALGPGPKVDLITLCHDEDRADEARAKQRRGVLALVRKPETPDVA